MLTYLAHETLCEDGIIHRDISAGNILIKMSAEYHQNAADGSETIVEEELDVTQGFLADFELASVKGPPSGQQGTVCIFCIRHVLNIANFVWQGRLRSQVHAAAGAQQSKPGDAMTVSLSTSNLTIGARTNTFTPGHD